MLVEAASTAALDVCNRSKNKSVPVFRLLLRTQEKIVDNVLIGQQRLINEGFNREAVAAIASRKVSLLKTCDGFDTGLFQLHSQLEPQR